ncbi:GIY-YIG nuclease family protein [Candidatus Sumerlaeota bacterium]
MSDTATVKIFLVQGDPASLRTAEISNWTGKAVAGPRSELDEIVRRDEAQKPGVYFLIGVNPDTGKETVYIGEAEVVKDRIKKHVEKDFWRSAVFFVSKDENLTKAHIKYLEGKLIEKAKKADRYELDNSNASGSHLPESDAADMEVFLAKIEQLMAVLGHDFLQPIAPAKPGGRKAAVLICSMKGVRATGRPTEKGFVVIKASEAVLTERPSTKTYPYAANLRKQLRDQAVLTEQNGKLVFNKDYEFSSPSAAASVIQGGQANGRTSWKNSAGETLKELEEKGLSNK